MSQLNRTLKGFSKLKIISFKTNKQRHTQIRQTNFRYWPLISQDQQCRWGTPSRQFRDSIASLSAEVVGLNPEHVMRRDVK